MMGLTMTDHWRPMTRPATSVPTGDDGPSDARNDARLRPSRRKTRKRKSHIPAAAIAIEAREGDDLTEFWQDFEFTLPTMIMFYDSTPNQVD
jgi:hypothetical protein